LAFIVFETIFPGSSYNKWNNVLHRTLPPSQKL